MKALHIFIIGNFVAEIAYVFYVFFFTLKPEDGSSGPLWGKAALIPMELMLRRRLYATELWIAILGLSIYLAITVIYPRIRKIQNEA